MVKALLGALKPKTAKKRPAKLEVKVGGRRLSASSEDVYQARRRYTRAGERYEKQAAEETGAAAEKLMQLANANYKKALATYENREAQARYAEKHGLPMPSKVASEKKRSQLVSQSVKVLERSRMDTETRRELEAFELMNGPVGSRIMAATKDIWYDPNMPKQDLTTAYLKIMKAFGVSSMADVIKKFEEELGEDVYKASAEDGDRYERDSPITIKAGAFARRILRNGK